MQIFQVSTKNLKQDLMVLDKYIFKILMDIGLRLMTGNTNNLSINYMCKELYKRMVKTTTDNMMQITLGEE
jgi:hypothetical protein